MEQELHASSFAPWYPMGADIRYIDIRGTKIRPAQGFGSAAQPAEVGRKFRCRNDHCGIQVDGRPIEIDANCALLLPIEHSKSTAP